jgi:hypothetical protein
LELTAQLLLGLARTSLIEPKLSNTTHSGLDLTQLTAVCRKDLFWAQKNSLPTQKNWLKSSAVVS